MSLLTGGHRTQRQLLGCSTKRILLLNGGGTNGVIELVFQERSLALLRDHITWLPPQRSRNGRK